jgi:hypothetical protein
MEGSLHGAWSVHFGRVWPVHLSVPCRRPIPGLHSKERNIELECSGVSAPQAQRALLEAQYVRVCGLGGPPPLVISIEALSPEEECGEADPAL